MGRLRGAAGVKKNKGKLGWMERKWELNKEWAGLSAWKPTRSEVGWSPLRSLCGSTQIPPCKSQPGDSQSSVPALPGLLSPHPGPKIPPGFGVNSPHESGKLTEEVVSGGGSSSHSQNLAGCCPNLKHPNKIRNETHEPTQRQGSGSLIKTK